MCGIAGITGENTADMLYKMLLSLKHRGPDGAGVFVDGKVAYGDIDGLKVPEGSFGMGHNLLSIVGYEGAQPIVHENFVLVSNGEIYNHREIKNSLKDDFVTDSDCEVIIKLVSRFYNDSLYDAVIKAVEYLDGDYAFAIYDGKNFAAIRDPVGVKPLYYGEDKAENISAFASERKALWEIGIKHVKTLSPDSILYDAQILKIGDRLRIRKADFKKNGTKSLKRPQEVTYRSYSLIDGLKKQLKEFLVKSVQKRIEGLSRVGILFSGGIDSTTIAKIADDLKVETTLYSVGHKDSQDVQFAKKTARDMGFHLKVKAIDVKDVKRYLPLVLNAVEEFNIMKLGVGMPAYIASEMANINGLKVMLSGQGADELLGGYHRYLKFYQEKGEEAQKDLKEDVYNLFHVNLQRDDAVTMANSVELRVPYLDLDVINIALNIPMKYKIIHEKDSLRKHILREVAVELEVPDYVISRPKKAAQYGSGIHKMIMRVLKDNKFDVELKKSLENKSLKRFDSKRVE